MAIDDLRRGRFKLAKQIINANPDAARLIMGNLIVIRAECLAMEDVIEYWGISPLFRELREGELIPKYEITFNAAKQLVWASEI